jgi:hypothetical protein
LWEQDLVDANLFALLQQRLVLPSKGGIIMSSGFGFGGFGWRQLLIFLLVIATIFVFVGGCFH